MSKNSELRKNNCNTRQFIATFEVNQFCILTRESFPSNSITQYYVPVEQLILNLTELTNKCSDVSCSTCVTVLLITNGHVV